MCVGTPHRLGQLVESGALKVGRLTHVLLDCNRDVKQRCLLDMPEIARDFWKLLFPLLRPQLEKKAKLALF